MGHRGFKFAGRLQHFKPEIAEICLALLDRSFQCNFSTSYEILDFISTIIENLKDAKAIFTGLDVEMETDMDMQIMALEGILRFLRHFVDFTAARAITYDKLEYFWNHVQGCTNKAACVSILIWARVTAEPKIESVLSDLLQKIEPFTPEVAEMYLGVLKTSRSSRFDTTLMSKVVASFVDFLLKNRPVFIKDSIPVLGENLMFLVTFLMDPPDQLSAPGGKLICAKIDAILGDAVSLICSFSVDETAAHVAKEWKKFLCELFQRIDVVKAEIKEVYVQFSDSSLSDFPKNNGIGFIHFLLGKIGEMLQCNADINTYSKYQIETIQKELVSFQSILNLQNENEKLEDIWMRIINVAYRVENVIDFILIMDSPIWDRMIHLSDVIERMKLIKLDVGEMEPTQMDNIRVLSDETKSRIDLPTEANISRMDVVVGFEDEARRISDQLTGGSLQLEIVSIVGMPGIGKTTLAMKVFNSPSIRLQFNTFAWCHVSQLHNRRKSLLNILNSVSVRDKLTSELSDDDLAFQLYMYLKLRKFLIVLDDIWDIEAWDYLRMTFPDDKNGSRILLTSRIHDVDLQANLNKHRHFLHPLSDEESWKLLKVKLFPDDVCPPEFLEVGQRIAKKCRGLPLAVVLNAAVLATKKQNLHIWEQVAQSPSAYIASEGCINILEPSYKHLSDILKSCFLYLGTFQQETVIKVKKLIRLWSAEGIIQETEWKSLEDVADKYLMDLNTRSLIIVDNISSTGRIKQCCVHDLLHYLCLAKAEAEGFHQLLNTSHLYLKGIKYKQYRLCIHSEWRPFVNSEPTGPNVRSLLFHPNNSSNEHPYAPDFFSGFQLLRVLDLEALLWGVLFPEELISLVHLRYLAVTGDFTSIPSSISSLLFLETLCLRSYDSIIVLPNTIFYMKRLRHVDVPTGATVSWDDYDLEKSILLHNLVSFSSLYVSRREDAEMLLRMLPKVWRLRFQFYNQFPALDFLDNLESLNVHKVGRAPYTDAIKYPSTLRKLTLSNLGLPWHEMSAIASLPNLEALKLLSRSFEGQCWNLGGFEFLSLKFLKLENLNVKRWKTSHSSFPCLQRVVVKDCVQLEGFPCTLAQIHTLQILEVHGCSSSVAESARAILEEQQQSFGNNIRIILTQTGEEHSSYSDANLPNDTPEPLLRHREEALLLQQQSSRPQSTGSISRPGDWICRSCQHLNFQRRDSCQRCGELKYGGKYDYGSFMGSGSSGPDVRPGDWYCTVFSCGASNFASRSSCFKCGALKDESSGGFDGDHMPRARGFGFGHGSSGASGWKSGDWICNRWGCNEHNFASRTECFRCSAPREFGSKPSY